MSKRKKPVKRKPSRKLKEYEIDVDVIDLDSYVAFHTQTYDISFEDSEGYITFIPMEEETLDFSREFVFSPEFTFGDDND